MESSKLGKCRDLCTNELGIKRSTSINSGKLYMFHQCMGKCSTMFDNADVVSAQQFDVSAYLTENAAGRAEMNKIVLIFLILFLIFLVITIILAIMHNKKNITPESKKR